MRINWIPLLFLPGVCISGYLVDEWAGVAWAVALWLAIVIVGTVVHALLHLGARTHRSSVESYSVSNPPGAG